MTRVLITKFDTIVGLGVRAVLADGGCETLEIRTSLAESIATLRPHALVVDLDDEPTSVAAVTIRKERPELAVVLCSSDRPQMCVYRRGVSVRSQDVPPTPEVLLAAVRKP